MRVYCNNCWHYYGGGYNPCGAPMRECHHQANRNNTITESPIRRFTSPLFLQHPTEKNWDNMCQDYSYGGPQWFQRTIATLGFFAFFLSIGMTIYLLARTPR